MKQSDHAQTLSAESEPHPVAAASNETPALEAVQNGQHAVPSGAPEVDESAGALAQQSPAYIGGGTPAPDSDAKRIAILAAMPSMDYDRLRKEEAKALGVQVKTLDDRVKAARNQTSDTQRLPFTEVESHPDPVVPAELFDEVAKLIRRYIVLDDEQVVAVTLWIVMTWVIDVVEIAPIAIITAPEKACGKSQLLQVLGYLASRPLSAASFTASFLFRAIQAWRPTVLIDEADTFIRDNDELKGLVNAGHTRANAFVGRTVAVGDGYEPRLFEVWGAKAFAGIALERHLPDATMSRGIVIVLRRKLPDEKVGRLRHADSGSFTSTAEKLARFSDDYSEQVRLARPRLPDELSDRAQDNWEPLLAIAECAGPEWLQRAISAALKLSSVSEQAVSTGNQLLADIQAVFRGRAGTKISTVDLIAALVADDEESWATYNRGKPLSPRQLAKQLGAYGIKSKTVRLSNGTTPKGYDLSEFEDAFARYLAATPALPQRRNDPTDPIRVMAIGIADAPLDIRNGPTPQETGTELDCGVVADKTGDGGDSPENVF